jgi:uncharacterized protein
VHCAHFRFYAELNDFLPPEERARDLPFRFFSTTAVKDAIESFGVPHTEVELIIANGESVGFSYTLRDGDRVSVYPVFESLDITPVLAVRPEALRVTRFVLDTHLGRLAGYLRMLGFDTLYRNDYSDRDLARISADGKRILLTRDRGLLMRSLVTHGYWVRETEVRRQVAEIVRRFDLGNSLRPFQRCLRCNTELSEASKEEVAGQLPARTGEFYDEFQRCPGCGRIYWKGSHYRRMQRFIESLAQEAGSALS